MAISHERLTSINQVLTNSRFLPETVSGENAWSGLIQAITELTDAGEILEIPERNGADAWRNAWKIYLSLRDRRRAREHEAQAPDRQLEAQKLRNEAATWDSLLVNRDALLWECAHGGLTTSLQEYIGLDPSLLELPQNEETERFSGRFHGWRGRAQVLSSAISKWKSMSPEEKRIAPLIVTLRRQAHVIQELQERVAALEAVGKVEAAA